jgi:phosphatidylinositol-3,4,5-trisphosphate 3-phosphatase/dual-specificity protein phosphatase PTEN
MDWLRKIVSGNRRRFQDNKYNLDITYITNRVLAMSFPASGIEQMYRNNITEVSYHKMHCVVKKIKSCFN